MIVYSNDKRGFIRDIPSIESILKTNIENLLGEESSENEIISWHNSLAFIGRVIDVDSIPDDAGISLEYNIPTFKNRIDFIISGNDADDKGNAVFIELKQWSKLQHTDKDAVVQTRYSDGMKETTHPSYQVRSYAALLYDMKEAVHNQDVLLHPCAYLHNHIDDGEISHPNYSTYTAKAPVFCKGDEEKLRKFITRFVKKGDRGKAMYEIENSNIRPSKQLIDCVNSMIAGNKEFHLIDEQMVAYQNILAAWKEYEKSGMRQVVIVHGGPGTGKSVIAVNVIAQMTRSGHTAHYITKNAAPRNVIKFKLSEAHNRKAATLFHSSTTYGNLPEMSLDMLVVDEAHRLQVRGADRYHMDESQVETIMRASKVSVFFIDEAQRVSIEDIRTADEITNCANAFGASVTHQRLHTQFRCSGSDVYLQWLDSILQIENTNPMRINTSQYDIRVMGNPSELIAEIEELNRKNDKSRVVAGYCWPWNSKKDKNLFDIEFPEYGVMRQWNFSNDNTWAISKGSVKQVGCIHTCQGLEFDYVGVIIGPDMIYENGRILVAPSKRDKMDSSLKGWRQKYADDMEKGKEIVRAIIKNTYRTLMTRGMKGCRVWAVNPNLNEYLKKYINEA